MPRKDFERRFFGLRPLQPLEIQRNRQRFLWKCLEKTSGDLEKLGKKVLEGRLCSAAFAPLPQRRGAGLEVAHDDLSGARHRTGARTGRISTAIASLNRL